MIKNETTTAIKNGQTKNKMRNIKKNMKIRK